MTGSPWIKAVFPEKRVPVYPAALKAENVRPILRFHKSVPGYRATPLHCVPQLARHLGIKNIYVKDESFRFGLNALKALGAATWAVARMLCERLECAVSDVEQVGVMDGSKRHPFTGR